MTYVKDESETFRLARQPCPRLSVVSESTCPLMILYEI